MKRPLTAAMTQAEVAAALGLTRNGVQLIEWRALRKLRAALVAAGVDGPGSETINWWGEQGGDDE